MKISICLDHWWGNGTAQINDLKQFQNQLAIWYYFSNAYMLLFGRDPLVLADLVASYNLHSPLTLSLIIDRGMSLDHHAELQQHL